MRDLNFCEKLVVTEMCMDGISSATLRIFMSVAQKLRADEGITSVEISRIAFTSEQNVLRHMRRLEEYGYIYRDAKKRWHSVVYEESIKDPGFRWIMSILPVRQQIVHLE